MSEEEEEGEGWRDKDFDAPPAWTLDSLVRPSFIGSHHQEGHEVGAGSP